MTDKDPTNGNHQGSNQEAVDEVSDLLDVSGIPGAEEEESGQELEPFQPKPVPSNFDARDQDHREDYERARTSIHNQQQMIEELSRITLESARLSNSPKFVEAFSQLMQRLTVVNEKMMQHQQYTKEGTPESKGNKSEGGDTHNTQNNLTINMTMEELMQEVGTQYDEEERQQQSKRSGRDRTGTTVDGDEEDPSTE